MTETTYTRPLPRWVRDFFGPRCDVCGEPVRKEHRRGSFRWRHLDPPATEHQPTRVLYARRR